MASLRAWTERCVVFVALLSACATSSAVEDGGGTTSSGSEGPGVGGGVTSVGSGSGPAVDGEVCGNGLDDDGDGGVDEDCPCDPGATQSCCGSGTQECVDDGEFVGWGPCGGVPPPSQELCDGEEDEDCDGDVDEGCGGAGASSSGSGQGGSPTTASSSGPGTTGTGGDPCAVDIPVDIDGDCVTKSCPPEAPYPVGCNIFMDGNDDRGCVANGPGSSTVYFQEGDDCGAGHVSGTLTCSCNQGAPLGAANCDINKDQKFYGPDSTVCPDT